MRMSRVLMCLLLPLLVLSGCSQKKNSSDNGNSVAAVGFVRIVNTVADSPALTATVATASAGSIGFREATSLGQQTPGATTVDVTYVDPISQATVKLFTAVPITVTANHIANLILKGTMAAPTSQVVDTTVDTLTATQAQVQFVNATSAAGNLDIFLTEFSASLTGATPSATLNTGVASTTVKITAANTLRLRVRPVGATTVIYDSASFPIVAAARRLIVVTETFGPDPAAVGTLVAGDATTLALPNTVAKGGVRVLNAIPDQVSVSETLTDRAAATTIGAANTVQIGRASCRERV